MDKRVPTTVDYSKDSISSNVNTQVFQNPISIYFTVFGILGVMGSLILGLGVKIIGISFGAILIGIFVLLFRFLFLKDFLAKKYLDKLNKAIEKHRIFMLNNVKNLLNKYKNSKGLENYANQGIEQFKRIKNKYDNFKEILEKKFTNSEMTYGRFLGTCEQLYLSVLDNLEVIAGSLKTADSIDDKYINTRMKYLNELKANGELKMADENEIKTLKERQQIKETQIEKINNLLTINEEVMTQIDKSTAKISDLKTMSGRASLDLDTAREELEMLIGRSEKYNHN